MHQYCLLFLFVFVGSCSFKDPDHASNSALRKPAEETLMREVHTWMSSDVELSDDDLQKWGRRERHTDRHSEGNLPRWSGPLPRSTDENHAGRPAEGRQARESKQASVVETCQQLLIPGYAVRVSDLISGHSRWSVRSLNQALLRTGNDQLMFSLASSVPEWALSFELIQKKAEPRGVQEQEALSVGHYLLALRVASTSLSVNQSSVECLQALVRMAEPELAGLLERAATSERVRAEHGQLVSQRQILFNQLNDNAASDGFDVGAEKELRQQIKINAQSLLVYMLLYPELM